MTKSLEKEKKSALPRYLDNDKRRSGKLTVRSGIEFESLAH